MEKEYIVTLKKGVDYEAFNQEMIATTGAGNIPSRAIDIANPRPGSLRNTHYSLTDEEAIELRKDSRVVDVQLPPEQRDDIEIMPFAIQQGDWRRTDSPMSANGNTDVSYHLPWGMLRSAYRQDPFEFTDQSAPKDFPYTLTGKGVDVVIQDSGIDKDHAEFWDENGNSRVRQIDWYEASGLPGTQSENHYEDYDGHGTHCAGTVAGRYYGWAKDADIYAVKVQGLEGSEGGGIPISDCFDVIKLWHRNKPIDPATGYKRPTVVNASWGYSGTRSDPSDIVYRGVNYTFANDAFGNDFLAWNQFGIVPPTSIFGRSIPVRVASVDADLQECIDEGIIFCIAAGNAYYYIASEGDQDWDNRADFGFGFDYYHRGSSPYDTEAFIVGCIDDDYTGDPVKESRAAFSNCGPGVDIYAGGSQIVSAMSTDRPPGGNNIRYNMDNADRYALYPYADNGFGVFIYNAMRITGTSMASPNVAGCIACLLELYPYATPAQIKTFIHNNSTKDSLKDLEGARFDDQSDLLGSPNRILYMPFSSTITGSMKRSN